MTGTVCPYCGRGGGKDPEILEGLGQIIKFCNISRSTFYRRYMKDLMNSGVVFSRPAKFGKRRYWSYKRLILAWLVQNFTDISEDNETL